MKFTAKAVPTIEYDFTAIPNGDGGKCSGKGLVPEPSDEVVDEFVEAATSLDVDEDTKFSEMREKMTDLLVTLGMPREHIEELPPRHFNAFRDWLVTQLLPNAG